MALTHWKKLTNPDYLGAYSIEDGKDLVMTIKMLRQEEVIGADGKKEECTVCYFTDSPDGKPMIMNSTNCKTMQKLFGTPYIEQWAGHKIQVGIEKVKAFGDIVEALRVRKFAPKTVSIKCEKCGNDILASNGMSAEQIAAYAKKKLGKTLCVACAQAESVATGKDKPNEADQK